MFLQRIAGGRWIASIRHFQWSHPSFLIATPENGPDSLVLSYALLGPVLTAARPIAAILSAVVAGLPVSLGATPVPPAPPAKQEECGSCGCCSAPTPEERPSILKGLRYAATDMLDDLLPWLLAGMVVAALIQGFFRPTRCFNGAAAWGRSSPCR